MPNDPRFRNAFARFYHKTKNTISTNTKAQVVSVALVLMLLFAAGIILLRSGRYSNPSPTSTVKAETALDGLTSSSGAADTSSFRLIGDAPLDGSFLRDSTKMPLEKVKVPPAKHAGETALSETPALSDTLRRFGSHATQVQMLIELLEEKQLLLEEKVELSRRLEIVEILDSALVHKAVLDSTTQSPAPSDSLELETDLLHKLDTLENTFPAQKSDTLSPQLQP